MDEQELARRCARSDDEARRELYETYSPRLLSLCRRYTRDAAEAEDMIQDAYIKIFRIIGRFRWTRPGSLYSWMARVALNLAFDSAKRRRRLARELMAVDSLVEEIPEEPEYGQAQAVPLEILLSMIEALPEGYRTVFRLYCIDELSHQEIAALLGIKEKSSSAGLARARAVLARSIRQYLNGEGLFLSGGPSPAKRPQDAARGRNDGEGIANESRPSPNGMQYSGKNEVIKVKTDEHRNK